MAWYLYNTVSGQYLNMTENVTGFDRIAVGHSQVEDPTIVGTVGQNYVYDQSQLRPGLPAEIAGFPAADLEVALIRSRSSAVDIIGKTDSELGLAIRAVIGWAVDEINIVRQQVNLNSSESQQLTDANFIDVDDAQARTDVSNKITSLQAD